MSVFTICMMSNELLILLWFVREYESSSVGRPQLALGMHFTLNPMSVTALLPPSSNPYSSTSCVCLQQMSYSI